MIDLNLIDVIIYLKKKMKKKKKMHCFSFLFSFIIIIIIIISLLINFRKAFILHNLIFYNFSNKVKNSVNLFGLGSARSLGLARSPYPARPGKWEMIFFQQAGPDLQKRNAFPTGRPDKKKERRIILRVSPGRQKKD